MRMLTFLLLPLVLLAGCAHVISDAARDRADSSVEFARLRENPDAYRGRFVILGGVIAGVQEIREGIQVEVTEFPVDYEDIPDPSAGSGGRFLVVFPRDVGYATFRVGMMVTMAGEVAGKAVKMLDRMEYTYPVLKVTEIHIIPPAPAYYYPGY